MFVSHGIGLGIGIGLRFEVLRRFDMARHLLEGLIDGQVGLDRDNDTLSMDGMDFSNLLVYISEHACI